MSFFPFGLNYLNTKYNKQCVAYYILLHVCYILCFHTYTHSFSQQIFRMCPSVCYTNSSSRYFCKSRTQNYSQYVILNTPLCEKCYPGCTYLFLRSSFSLSWSSNFMLRLSFANWNTIRTWEFINSVYVWGGMCSVNGHKTANVLTAKLPEALE